MYSQCLLPPQAQTDYESWRDPQLLMTTRSRYGAPVNGPGVEYVDRLSAWRRWTCGFPAPSPCVCCCRAWCSWSCAFRLPAPVPRVAPASGLKALRTASMSPVVCHAWRRSRPTSRWTPSCCSWTETTYPWCPIAYFMAWGCFGGSISPIMLWKPSARGRSSDWRALWKCWTFPTTGLLACTRMRSHGWRHVWWWTTTLGIATAPCSRRWVAWRTTMRPPRACCAEVQSWGTRRASRSWLWTRTCATWPSGPPTTPCWWPCLAGLRWLSLTLCTMYGRTRKMRDDILSTWNHFPASPRIRMNWRTSARLCDVTAIVRSQRLKAHSHQEW